MNNVLVNSILAKCATKTNYKVNVFTGETEADKALAKALEEGNSSVRIEKEWVNEGSRQVLTIMQIRNKKATANADNNNERAWVLFEDAFGKQGWQSLIFEEDGTAWEKGMKIEAMCNVATEKMVLFAEGGEVNGVQTLKYTTVEKDTLVIRFGGATKANSTSILAITQIAHAPTSVAAAASSFAV